MIGMGLTLMIGPGQADTVDRVRFAQAPVLVVWSDGKTPDIGAEITLNAPSVPMAAKSFPGAGQLEPIATINHATQRDQVFRIASNSAFRISATAYSTVETSDTPITVTVRYPGENADASLTGSHITTASLATLLGKQPLLTVPRKTARRQGAPESQSLEVEIDWGASPMGAIAVQLEAISE